MSARPAVYLRKGSRVRTRYSAEVFVVVSRLRTTVLLRPLFEILAQPNTGVWVRIDRLIAIEEHPAG